MNKIVVIYLFIVLMMAIGWVKNIVKFVECDFEPPYKAEIIHGLGLFPPVGVFVGWVNVGK